MAPPSTPPAGPFNSLKEFYPFYKQEHCKTGTRALHVIGTSLFLLQAAAAGATRQPKLLLTGVLSAYSCAWLGHFFVEHNRCVDLYTGGGGSPQVAAAVFKCCMVWAATTPLAVSCQAVLSSPLAVVCSCHTHTHTHTHTGQPRSSTPCTP